MFTFLLLFLCCTSFCCAVKTIWALIRDQSDVTHQGTAAKRAAEREREISHTPFTQTTSLHLFFLLCRSLCALCTAVRTETLGEFYRSGLDIRFLLQCELSVVVSLCANRYSRSSGFLKEQLRYLWLFPFLSRNDSHAAVCKRIQTLQGEHIAVSSILE